MCHFFALLHEVLNLTTLSVALFCIAYEIADESVCHWKAFCSLIAVLLECCVNIPLEIGLQECLYFQQVTFAEFLPSVFFRSKVRKMHFLRLTFGFYFKTAVVFIHSYTRCCLRLLCKSACGKSLVIIKFPLWAFLFNPELGCWLSNGCRPTPA